jgi:hypothetical protein
MCSRKQIPARRAMNSHQALWAGMHWTPLDVCNVVNPSGKPPIEQRPKPAKSYNEGRFK